MTEQVFDFDIRQQPDIGRMCGVKDVVNRRVLDPPLIIELKPSNYTEGPFSNRMLPLDSYVLNVSLTSEDCKESRNDFRAGRHIRHNIIGDTVGNARILLDPEDRKHKPFFVLPNISIRLTGTYTICCTVINVVSGQVSTKFTRPLNVYSCGQFPGYLATSKLTRSFIYQGLSVREKGVKAKLPLLLENEKHIQNYPTTDSNQTLPA
ncbi:velvet factor [Globomyces pollinis-pini]|nr:velvet factor [Globomyces pollinis-pini]